jgi:hypothetical protein
MRNDENSKMEKKEAKRKEKIDFLAFVIFNKFTNEAKIC